MVNTIVWLLLITLLLLFRFFTTSGFVLSAPLGEALKTKK